MVAVVDGITAIGIDLEEGLRIAGFKLVGQLGVAIAVDCRDPGHRRLGWRILRNVDPIDRLGCQGNVVVFIQHLNKHLERKRKKKMERQPKIWVKRTWEAHQIKEGQDNHAIAVELLATWPLLLIAIKFNEDKTNPSRKSGFQDEQRSLWNFYLHRPWLDFQF